MPTRPSIPSVSDVPRVVIPRLNKDPVWSLQPWPIEVVAAREVFVIPPTSAADWLSYLMLEKPDLDGIVIDLLPGIEELVYKELLDLDDLYEICLDLIEAASARHWWVAMRLINGARNAWDLIGGELAFRGINAGTMSLAGWLDAVVLIIYKNLKSEEVAMFTMQLELPPPEEVQAEVEELEMSREAFLAMAR